MPLVAVTCNKCKHSGAREGDTWCLGCSSLDVGQDLLKKSWNSPAIRAVAEESCLHLARSVKALFNLDRGLQIQEQKQQRVNLTAATKTQPAPPRRSRSRDRTRGESAASTRPAHPKAKETVERPPLPTGDSYEYTESEEEETEVKPESSAARPGREHGHSRPAPPPPPRVHQEPQRAPQHKKTRRAGKKHQRHGQRPWQIPFAPLIGVWEATLWNWPPAFQLVSQGDPKNPLLA